MHELSGLFINAEGKAGGRTAVQALLRAGWDVNLNATNIFVAEADYRRSDADEDYEICYHKRYWRVLRHKLHEGRAMKVFIDKGCDDMLVAVEWLERSVVLTFRDGAECVEIYASHFAHGEKWLENLAEISFRMSSTGFKKIVVGDLNAESRPCSQTVTQREQWQALEAEMEAFGLSQLDLSLLFSR